MLKSFNLTLWSVIYCAILVDQRGYKSPHYSFTTWRPPNSILPGPPQKLETGLIKTQTVSKNTKWTNVQNCSAVLWMSCWPVATRGQSGVPLHPSVLASCVSCKAACSLLNKHLGFKKEAASFLWNYLAKTVISAAVSHSNGSVWRSLRPWDLSQCLSIRSLWWTPTFTPGTILQTTVPPSQQQLSTACRAGAGQTYICGVWTLNFLVSWSLKLRLDHVNYCTFLNEASVNFFYFTSFNVSFKRFWMFSVFTGCLFFRGSGV